jgi:hypothetical protein
MLEKVEVSRSDIKLRLLCSVRFEVLIAVTEDYCLLGCDNMSSNRSLPCLKRVVLISHCHMVRSAGNFKIKVLGVLVYTGSPCGGKLGYLHCSPARESGAWEYI